ncbi:hypothetical protein [Streptomyces himastatinicus]|uniref:hypothetical protein n=1 Tax=Streptomyces himastatinicus TaxID=998084 RepID=UPI0001B4FB28|nr:hypothetical protein [Streptomyces himastatinicus]
MMWCSSQTHQPGGLLRSFFFLEPAESCVRVSQSMPRRTWGSPPPPGRRSSTELISAVSSAMGQLWALEKPQ